jgi:hypothetical protein
VYQRRLRERQTYIFPEATRSQPGSNRSHRRPNGSQHP